MPSLVDDLVIVGKNYLGLRKECKYEGCFVAGTLVHTDKGLVPIEQLKIGDMVLSKNENGKGEQAYKRVINTFKSAEKLPIVKVQFQNPNKSCSEMHLFCTDNHPFWALTEEEYESGWNWKPALDLEIQAAYVIDLNESRLLLSETTSYLFATCETGIAYEIYGYSRGRFLDGYSMIVDFRDGNPTLITAENGWVYSFNENSWHPSENIYVLPNASPEKKFYEDVMSKTEDLFLENALCLDDTYYMDYVYNIEVEDLHTYYVGKAGIWVHSS